jgi:SAM-dependent methyltransferase
MRGLNSIFKLCMIFGLTLIIATVCAQAQQQGDYQPTVGQQGKDVVWVPTPEDLVQRMLDMAKVTPKDYVVDLGSGDGRTVIAAAKRGARSLGIEYNPDMVELSKKNAMKAGVSEKATFSHADIFESDFSTANVITLFLLPDLNIKLRPKILAMKPGTRVVSNSFTMDSWKPDETSTLESNCISWCTAYLWIVPAKAAGKWSFPGGMLTIEQEFQAIPSGSLAFGGKTMPISGKLTGNKISFTAGEVEYTGEVQGDVLTFKSGSGEAKRAMRSH